MDNSTNYRGALLDAIYIDDTALLSGYLETVSAEAFKDDIKSLIELNDKRASESLKAFTMAAMQGLLSQGDIKRVCQVGERLGTDYVGAIAKMSLEIARATLSELSKQQQP